MNMSRPAASSAAGGVDLQPDRFGVADVLLLENRADWNAHHADSKRGRRREGS